MALLVPDVGEVRMLRHLLNNAAPENLLLKLYKNDITPADTDTALTYTEATFAGYAAITLTGANWNFTTGTPSFAQYSAAQSFVASAGAQNQNVYGYYVVQASSGILLWAERFVGAPIYVNNNGDTIQVTPYIELA